MKIKEKQKAYYDDLKPGDVFREANGCLHMKTDGVRSCDGDFYDAVRLIDGHMIRGFVGDCEVEVVHGAFAEGES